MCGMRADYSTWSNSEIVADLSGASFVDGSFDGLDIRFSFTPDGPIKVAGALLGGLGRGGGMQLDPPGSSAASSSAPQFGRGRNRF